MALSITVTADIEPQLPSAKQLDSVSSDSDLSDSGRGSILSFHLDFTYPGERLSDDEFNQEFSCTSSRRDTAYSQVSSQATPTLSPASPGSTVTPLQLIPPPPPLPPLPLEFRTTPHLISLEPWDRSDDRDLVSCIYCGTDVLDRGLAQYNECCSTVICYHCTSYLSHQESGYCPNCGHYTSDYDYDHAADSGATAECIVCFDEVAEFRNKQSCCSQVICKSCVKEIVRTTIEDEGRAHIPCPNPECEMGVITREEILKHISGDTKEKYERFRLPESGGNKKTCPNCCLITEHKLPRKFKRYREEDVMITCSKCQHVWCYRCHAPWHQGVTCKQFQRGEKHFTKWRKSKSKSGTANCQKCPLCRVYIQRSDGCDHMTCNRCETEFCYKCGGRFTGSLPILGDHYTNTSIFGCKDYKANKPVEREAVRWGYLGAKLAMLAGYPVLFVAGVAVVVLVGAVALPIYGGYTYYKFKRNMHRTRKLYDKRRRH